MSRRSRKTPCPDEVGAFARQTVGYVQRALSLELAFDSETLPILDHYLRSIPDEPAIVALTATTAGAYFGEVIRRILGGRWDLSTGDPATWRIILPTGLSFAPAGVVAEAIAVSDDASIESGFDVPARLRPYLEQALSRMGAVTVDEYYSLCGRLDTLEHLHEVTLAIAAKLSAEAKKRREQN